jgi:hypothetical protein
LNRQLDRLGETNPLARFAKVRTSWVVVSSRMWSGTVKLPCRRIYNTIYIG